MKNSIWFHNLKNFNKENLIIALRHSLYVLSAVWLAIEIITYLKFDIAEKFRWYLILIPVLLVFIGDFFRLINIKQKNINLENDVEMEIRIGDIFNLNDSVKGNIVIPINNEIEFEHIEKRAMISQLINYYDSKNEFYNILSEKLTGEEKYPIGTVFKIKLPSKIQNSANDRFAYLLVTTKLNSNKRALNNLEDLKNAINQLWKYIAENEDTSSLIIPLIGTGRQRILIQINQLLRIFIESFYKQIKKKKFTKKISIVITKESYEKNKLNLSDVEKFVESYVKFY